MLQRVMMARMTASEFLHWMAFYKLEAEANDPDAQRNKQLEESRNNRQPALKQETPEQQLAALKIWTGKKGKLKRKDK